MPPDASAPLPTVSAIVPVFDGRHYLERSLPALTRALGGELLELLVVDDGSTDGSGEFAASLGARLLHTGGRLGPGAARNLGAAQARGEVLWLVDADVVVHDDAPRRVRERFARVLADASEKRPLVALFGSYDDAPPERNFASRYMNLRHHWTHQQAGGEASTFWAGCGAVRRDAYLAAGGFDARRFARPSIEDIELGYRLCDAGGRIELDPALQGTHLKRWRLREALETDVFRRAVPWARLLLARPASQAELNVSPVERARAALAGVVALLAALAVVGAAPLWAPVVALVAAGLANAPLLRFFARRGGPWFALRALVYHQLYYLYSTAVYLGCWLERRLGRGAGAGSGIVAP
jgi:glycosyltransferase involved in cell wall biosynthesis